MQYAKDAVATSGYLSDGNTTTESINIAQLEGHQWSQLQDGTIEVTDYLPKKEYYMSLRRFDSQIPGSTTGTAHRLGSISSGSLLGPSNGTGGLANTTLPSSGVVVQPTSPRSTGGSMRRVRTNTSVVDFKPSGKIVDCAVVMLDGTTREFRLDKAAYGQQLFDSVCTHLDLLEVEFFGLTYYDSTRNWYWLQLDKKIAKQLGKNEWQFEFQVRFYPYDMDSIKEDLTRYYLCLQVRQDIVSGQLPCSFMTYCLLGSYIVQSEAGDHDPTQHIDIKYIQDHPFAPHMLQTPEMLERIVQLHKLHRGKTPEEADRLFLNNARILALYGVDLHKVKNSQDEDINLGVYHGGILQYRNRIRLMRISWRRIISLSRRGRNFVIALRPIDNEPFGRNLTFKCSNDSFAKRLYTVCVEHHEFFRLRGSSRPKKPSLFPSFASRKYHYPSDVLHSPTLYHPAGNGPARTLSKFHPIPGHLNNPGFFTLEPRAKDDPHLNGSMASQYQYQPSMMPGEMNALKVTDQQMTNGQFMPGAQGAQRSFLPGTTGFNGANATTGAVRAPHDRPRFEPENWRISPADRTSGLGIDTRGVDVAAQRGAGWQGCRANKGVKAPGAYYYEVACLEDGLVRVGWSTNEASLELGTDNCGFGFGADLTVPSTGAGAGRAMHRNTGHDYGMMVQQGDVLGCLLDLDKGSVAWSVNGKVFQRAFTIPDQLRGESFLPAASLKDSRLLFNFGDESLAFPPGDSFTPVALATDDSQVPNRNTGWRLNSYDASAGMDVAPDGSMAQAQFGQGWQGCRANQGIRGPGRFYFEVTPMEEHGLCRIGWSTEDANLDLGSDRFGFGYGADTQGFGLNGQQGKRMHADEIDNYGEAFTKDDVIGCYLDTIEHTLKWSKNGIDFGDAYRIPAEFSNPTSLVAFFPSVSLLNSTVEVNFGDKPFRFYPGPDWTPVCWAPMDYVKRTKRKGPERKVKGWSYIDPSVLEPVMLQQMKIGHAAAAVGAARAVERREEDYMRAVTHTAPHTTHQPSSTASGAVADFSSTSPTTVPRQLPPGAVAMPGLTSSPIGTTSSSRYTTTSGPASSNRTAQSASSASTFVNGTRGTETYGSPTVTAVSSTPNTQSPIASNEQSPPIFDLREGPRRVLNGEVVSVQRSEPQVEAESFYDENGKLIRRTIKRSEVVTTKTVSERIIAGAIDPTKTDGLVCADDFDRALDMALHEVTKLDRDTSVLNNTVGHVEIPTKPESAI